MSKLHKQNLAGGGNSVRGFCPQAQSPAILVPLLTWKIRIYQSLEACQSDKGQPHCDDHDHDFGDVDSDEGECLALSNTERCSSSTAYTFTASKSFSASLVSCLLRKTLSENVLSSATEHRKISSLGAP